MIAFADMPTGCLRRLRQVADGLAGARERDRGRWRGTPAEE
ncbi:hypothetical protein [Streptacidiphilus sp. P02-A3a]|nr:hypothetical protein [Streptacidiphilus sp. P02-A3a]